MILELMSHNRGVWSEEERLELLRLMEVFPVESNGDARYGKYLCDSYNMSHII